MCLIGILFPRLWGGVDLVFLVDAADVDSNPKTNGSEGSDSEPTGHWQGSPSGFLVSSEKFEEEEG